MTDIKYQAHSPVCTCVYSHTFDEGKLPTSIWPILVDVGFMADGLRISQYKMEPFTLASTNPPQQSFIEYVQMLPAHKSVLLSNFELLADNIQQGCTPQKSDMNNLSLSWMEEQPQTSDHMDESLDSTMAPDWQGTGKFFWSRSKVVLCRSLWG
jgi:hypothetical protein